MKVYKSDSTEIPILTNGDFSTADSPSHNRYDAKVNGVLILELDQAMTVDTLNISAGNAAWGGTEMPKDLSLWYFSGGADDDFSFDLVNDDTKWTLVDAQPAISYAAPNGCNDKNAAEMQSFHLPPNVPQSQFFRLVIHNNWGNGDQAVFRQISLEQAAAAAAAVAVADQQQQLNDIDQSIHSLCADVMTVFSELESDKCTVDSCRSMLQAINEKGVNVESVFIPLEDQSNNIQTSIDAFKGRFQSACDTIAVLLAEMREEAAKVGPLD